MFDVCEAERLNERLENHEGFLKVDQVATLLSVHQQTVYRWIREGRIEARKIGRMVRVPISEYYRFIDQNPRSLARDEARRRAVRDRLGRRDLLLLGGP